MLALVDERVPHLVCSNAAICSDSGPQLEPGPSSQRPSLVEGRPIFTKRCMCSLKPRPQFLWVDRAQVLAGTGTQRTLKPNQIICRTLAILGGLGGPHRRSDDILSERSHIGLNMLHRRPLR